MRTIIIILLVLNSIASSAQSLRQLKLTRDDIKNGVKWRYEYREKHSFNEEKLLLLKNGRYKYSLNNFFQNTFSEGNWIVIDKIIILNSDIKRNNVPISISYTMDTTDIVNMFKFGVVKNRKNVFLTDAFININSDKVKCLPSAGGCIGDYNRIDSVRLLFENGFTSKWIKIGQNNKYVLIKVEVDFRISDYQAFDNFRYRLNNKLLTPVGN